MKDYVQNLFEECVTGATEEELLIIGQLLEGIQRKKKEVNGSMIGGIFAMDREVKDGNFEVSIPITPVTYNSLGIVHGGVTATLVDTAMGTLANMMLPEGYGAVTTNLNVHYLAPGVGERLTAHANLVHQGSKTLVVDGKVVSSEGKVVAHSTGSFFIIKKNG
ncbi:PaaI family thioesterase [Bacillus sp. KH172YL63]|uniref:PaaI family thioesterase n=1 Tax=Bacillus sp. KH172YL63 TaxID=2709784 RepID=UPI0013E4AFC6|nr:PaaI family thioesterase [Bacillus sp. KH172YL63]BCB03229.1 aromatic compound degradation protein PaaI [Bacillus sp. KH172YL63]